MYRKLVFVTALLVAVAGRSQVSLTLQVPPGGVLLKKQLWNMALVYTGNTPIYIRLSLTVSNAAGDQQLITAVTPSILLSKGAKQIQATDVAPVQYQYLSPTITDRDPDGFIPVGDYQACYTVLLTDERNSPLAEDCISFEVEPSSPPVLNTPGDEDTLTTTLPQFTWLPPAPLNIFSRLSYRFNLVQVQTGQNPLDAMEQNLPVYTNQNIADIFINYPASSLSLDTGKVYAWQVIAQNNLQPTAQSEVWTFRIRVLNPPVSTVGNSYIILKKQGPLTGAYQTENGSIGIKYYSFDRDHTADVSFFNSGGGLVTKISRDIAYGDNYLNFTLNSPFKAGQIYFIEISDLRNNKYSASFRIK